MPTKRHVRCPCCGWMVDLDKVRRIRKVEFQLFDQSFGGRIPRAEAENYKHRRGTAGIMNYDEITDPAEIEDAKEIFRKRVKAAAASLA